MSVWLFIKTDMKVKNRVKSHQDFQKVINTKKSISNKTYVLYYADNELGYTRIGISTSKKLGNAVIRGRIRRQVRVIAKTVIGLDNSRDYVIIVRKEYLKGDFLKNQEELRQLYIKTQKNF
ncbi:MAG: ribonuclease P protein component [Bacilli bacterium]